MFEATLINNNHNTDFIAEIKVLKNVEKKIMYCLSQSVRKCTVCQVQTAKSQISLAKYKV